MNQHNFYNCLFLWKPKICLKGTVARDFLPRIFLSWIDRIPRPKICLKLRKWSSKVADLKLRTSEKIAMRSCGLAVAEQHFFIKLRNCDCGSAFFKLRNCDCGLKKKLRVPTSGIYRAEMSGMMNMINFLEFNDVQEEWDRSVEIWRKESEIYFDNN